MLENTEPVKKSRGRPRKDGSPAQPKTVTAAAPAKITTTPAPAPSKRTTRAAAQAEARLALLTMLQAARIETIRAESHYGTVDVTVEFHFDIKNSDFVNIARVLEQVRKVM